jgi:hypothetical protein
LEALLRRRTHYILTRKVRRDHKRNGLLIAHLLTATLIALTWALGAARGVIDNSMLHAGAALVTAFSLIVVATGLLSYPDPYDPRLHASGANPPGPGQPARCPTSGRGEHD